MLIFMNRFKNRVCLVTGSASGIGLATATQMHEEGGRVLIVDRNAQAAEAAQKKLGGESAFQACDVGRAEDVQACVAAALKRWGQIDVLVNNAAMMVFAPVVELDVGAWDQVQAVNLRSTFLFSKLCLPHMRPGGAIVNVSSVHAYETTANCSAYAASKGGIEAFTRALSRELDPKNVRVNAVAPGAVNTPLLWSNPNLKNGAEKIEGMIGEPRDLANAICFLASSDARYVHGTTLIVDGGRLDVL